MREFLTAILGLLALLVLAGIFIAPASAHELSGKAAPIIEKSNDLPKCPSWFQCRP